MSKPVPSTTLSALLAGMTSASNQRERLPCRVLAYRETIPPGLLGSYVALAGAGYALQVGLLSDLLGWQSLSRVNEPDESRARDAVVEAAAELVTQVARAFRSALPDASEVTVGLPLFVDGPVLLGAATEAQAADIVLGSTRALLVLLTPRAVSRVPSVPLDDAAPAQLHAAGVLEVAR